MAEMDHGAVGGMVMDPNDPDVIRSEACVGVRLRVSNVAAATAYRTDTGAVQGS